MYSNRWTCACIWGLVTRASKGSIHRKNALGVEGYANRFNKGRGACPAGTQNQPGGAAANINSIGRNRMLLRGEQQYRDRRHAPARRMGWQRAAWLAAVLTVAQPTASLSEEPDAKAAMKLARTPGTRSAHISSAFSAEPPAAWKTSNTPPRCERPAKMALFGTRRAYRL